MLPKLGLITLDLPPCTDEIKKVISQKSEILLRSTKYQSQIFAGIPRHLGIHWSTEEMTSIMPALCIFIKRREGNQTAESTEVSHCCPSWARFCKAA